MIPTLPATLAPPAPFPLVLAQSRDDEFVAPGVRRATFRLSTSDGPLVVSLVAIDPREPTVRFDSVVANDRMISNGETISAMAKRTHAVAGINADYFDIGNTNQPLNLVVRSGALLRTPSQRIVLTVHRDRTVRFERASFAGTVAYGSTSLPLTTVNEWPPQGGVGLLTSAYGARRDVPGVRVFPLARVAGESPNDIAGTYTVGAVSTPPPSGGPANAALARELAFGPAALALALPPQAGDTVTLAATLSPALGDVLAAVGGGPLLLAQSIVANDPYSPAPQERDRRFPVSGAGTTSAGDVLFGCVDGRSADSIGLTRPQFAALWLGLGASDAMAFDSGGSAELVARKLGDVAASVLGSPSDGEERAVADGLFVYSDAPLGAPTRLVVHPREIVALPNVDVPVTLAVIDAAGHSFGAAHAAGGDVVAADARSHETTVRARGLSARVRVTVVAKPTTLAFVPDVRDPDPGATVRFAAHAFDASGRAIALGDAVKWTTSSGTFVTPGILHAGSRNATIVATVGDTRARQTLLVGHHVAPLDVFNAANADRWHPTSAPNAGHATVAVTNDVLTLGYDFASDGRAAYANANFLLPGEPLQFSLDVLGDGSGVGLRAAFTNGLGERRALSLVKAIDWKGWRTVSVTLPDDVAAPIHLVALSAYDGAGGATTRAVGTLALRNPRATIAGTP